MSTESCALQLSRALTITGWMSPAELEWLARSATTRRLIVELGSYAGRSTRAMADNLPEGGLLVAVDSWGSSYPDMAPDETPPWRAFQEFHRNLHDLMVRGRVIAVVMRHEDGPRPLIDRVPALAGGADMVFIDGDHRRATVERDVRNWLPLVNAGGLLCGHDYDRASWPGVVEAVDHLLPHRLIAPKTTIWYVTC